MTEQCEPCPAGDGDTLKHSPRSATQHCSLAQGRFRWAAQRSGDKDQRNLDNSRVLWRRNLEQNRRDVVRDGCTFSHLCSALWELLSNLAWPDVSASGALEQVQISPE